MTISIDGWQVPGYEITVGACVKLEGEDLSGYGSFALSSDNGVKPGVLNVSTKIPFVDADQLTKLVNMAKELDKNGARVERTINSDVAKAYKIRKAKFDGMVKTKEEKEVKAWLVTFNLLEVQSKSEREQQQIDGNAAQSNSSQSNQGHANVQAAFESAEGP